MSPRAATAKRAHRLGLAGVALGLLAALAACGRSADQATTSQSEEARQSRVVAAPAAEAVAPDAGGGAAPVAARRELIHIVQLQIAVDDVGVALAQAETLCIRSGGYVASASTEQGAQLPAASATMRVPSARLDAVVAGLRTLATRVLRETRQVEDVTAQVTDLDARLRALRATEDELLALLRESRARGQKVEDIMAVYRELTGIRMQIEQHEGQLRVVREQVALSTIHLEIRAEGSGAALAAPSWRPGATLGAALRSLNRALRGFADLLIYAVVVFVPLIAIGYGLFWIGRRVARRIRRTPPR